MKISAVIPVYGCPAAVQPLCERLSRALVQISSDYEIILVNDACPKGSWAEIEKACNENDRVVGIELSRNFGQMKAILAGLEYAAGDWIVVMDCDLQDRPEEIINLYNKAQEGYDVVFARRKVRKDNPLKVFLAKQFYKIYRFATDGNYDEAVCNFSVIKRCVAESYCQMREEHRGYVMYLRWLGFRQTAIDVQHDSRYEGISSYSLRRRVDMALELLSSQSDKPLRMMVGVGFCVAAVSLLALIYLVVNFFVRHVTIGWTSIVASVFLMGGFTIMVIGIVGIYVGNIFMQTKGRPLYIIRQIKGGGEKQ